MPARRGIDRAVQTVGVLGSLVFVNILGLSYFGRLDLTRDGQFTLSEATKETVSSLADPVTVRAYFTKDLPPPFSTNARYVRDLLEEYYVHGKGNFQYEFVDPASAETEEDRQKKKEVQRDIFGRMVRERTSIEQEMQSLGIPSVQVHVNEGDKLEVKRAYMGMAIRYRDKTEVIPMVQDTSGLEYDLTTLVRKLTREKTPKIGILEGHEGPSLQKDLARAYGLISQLYDVVTLDLTKDGEIADDIDAILVVGPKTPLGEEEQREIDGFIGSGKAVAFLLDVVKPDLETLQAEEAHHGLTDLLASYGVQIGSELVLDAECATINVTQQQGFMRIMQPVRYPFVPQPRALDPLHPLTRGLSQVGFPFMAPLEVTLPADGEVKTEVLVRSSEKSWVQQPPFNLNPFQRWTMDGAAASPRDLVVTLQGPIPIHFASASTESDQSRPSGRVLVAGGSSFLTDQFLSKGNETLALNLVDWLVLDDALLAVRSRGLRAAPLEDIDQRMRDLIKYANVLGLPLAFIVFGLVRWRLRESRRGQVRISA